MKPKKTIPTSTRASVEERQDYAAPNAARGGSRATGRTAGSGGHTKRTDLAGRRVRRGTPGY